ncbi:MAG: protein kinase family protein [Coriobacteriaceae bacterium]
MENDPLAAYLAALARDDCYRVDEVLRRRPMRTTEVVYFVGAKRRSSGRSSASASRLMRPWGDAYGHLFRAQRAGRRFRHLPRIYDVHTTGDELVVVMEYIQGRTLRDEVYERDGSLALAAQWFPLLCDGVMELHEQFSPPLIHRDLKPSNIVVSDAGLTIIDFGIARAFREGAAGTRLISARAATRRPSSSATGRPTSAATCTRWECCSTTCWPSAIRRRRWLRRDSRGRKCLSRCAPCSSAPAPLIRRPASRRCAT